MILNFRSELSLPLITLKIATVKLSMRRKMPDRSILNLSLINRKASTNVKILRITISEILMLIIVISISNK